MAEVTEGAKLHDRATRGESLSETEQAALEQWYLERDAAETRLLQSNASGDASNLVPVDFQGVLSQIRETATRIETLYEQNATLRAEIAALQERLAARAA